MRQLVVAVSIAFALAAVEGVLAQRGRGGVVGPRPTVVAPERDECPTERSIVEIREANPSVNRALHNQMRDRFIERVQQPNTTILLGPNVTLDFSGVPDENLPIPIGRCVTIKSVARFATPPPASGRGERRGGFGRGRGLDADVRGDRATVAVADEPTIRAIPEARSSTAPGPLLKFGPHRRSGDKVFLQARCYVGVPDQADHIRIFGFRIHGPSLGQQDAGDKGILIDKCGDIEISNMEVAGFGGEAIRVQDDSNEYFNPPILAEAWQLRGIEGVCREPPYNGPNGRIGSPEQVRIVGNFIHSNQQPRGVLDNHAGGYGVLVTHGAHALISQNVFSTNRHSIAAGGTMGGYQATQNLVLRYGGVHFDTVFTVHTHAFDIHGTGSNGFSGWAGARTTYAHNAFQYDNGNAIKVRGSPRCGIDIHDNVFPHEGFENDRGDDAVALEYRQDIGAIKLGPNNKLDTQTYGQYGVCDFDGDGVDDLFLATGVSWWFSGMGEFPWRFLALRNEPLRQLRFGYFDNDNKCDVLTESNNSWVISSGGTGEWYRLSQPFAPLAEVAFGRFDLTQRDARPGVTKRTTHAFWRTGTGQWKTTTLTGPDQGWKDAGSSRFPMSELKFGDYNGDGVTDVLAVESGRWAISSGAAGRWTRINASLGTDVTGLFVADVDHNGKDDLIRVNYSARPGIAGTLTHNYGWEISYDGASPWRQLRTYQWSGISTLRIPVFAGRFGTAPGAGVLTIDPGGIGRFYAPLESRAGANPNWSSTFRY